VVGDITDMDMSMPGSSGKRSQSESSEGEPSPSPKRMKQDPDTPDSGANTSTEDPLAKLLQPPEDKSKKPTSPRPNLPKLDLEAASKVNADNDSSNTPLFDTPTTPHPDGAAAQERSKQEAVKAEREKMQLLVSSFTEDQLDRYAMYRRAALPKATIKKIMQTLTGSSVGHNVVIAMAGIAKVFAGEVVEEALTNLEESGETGHPLRPKHLREAVRKMRGKGYMPKSKKQCPFK